MPNITINLSTDTKERLFKVAKQFNIPVSHLIRDTCENFIPFINIPDDFIIHSGITKLLTAGTPVRTILPFLTSMLGYTMVDKYIIKLHGKQIEIDPYPEYSMLCGIKMAERLYATITELERKNGR